MISITINNKEYKIRYSYAVLGQTDLLDKVIKASETEGAESMQRIIGVTAELLLAGLQKYHRGEFGYSTEKEKVKKLEIVYDLLDSYDDESTDEHPQDVFDLFEKMQDELGRTGFLSKVRQMSAPELVATTEAE